MKRKLTKEAIKGVEFVIFVLAIAIMASIFGEYEANSIYAANSIELESVPMEIEKPIAIVNLDSGLIQNDKRVNYGTDLIGNVSEDTVVTGLGDARQGIEDGEYSAYIIIPAHFSERVATINNQPEKSMLIYAISKEIALMEREKVLGGVINIYNTFSNALSKVYISSLLKEYHEVQDAANGIIDRDRLDLEKLLAVNGYDLVEIVEIPELETVDKEFTSLDLSDQYAKSTDTIAAIDFSYKTSLGNGQSAYQEILDEFTDIEDYEETTIQKIKDAGNDINSVSVPGNEEPQRQRTEEAEYARIQREITGDGGLLKIYDQDLSVFNQSVLEQSAKYDATEELYRDFLEQFDSDFVKEAVDEQMVVSVDGNSVSLDANNITYSMISEVELALYKEEIKQEYAFKLMNVVGKAVETFPLYYEAEPVEPEMPEEPEEESEEESTEPEEQSGGGGEQISDFYVAAERMSQIILEIAQGLPYDVVAYEEYVENHILVHCTPVTTKQVVAIIPKDNIEIPQIRKDGDVYTVMPSIDSDKITTEIEKMITTARTGNAARNTEYTTLSSGYQSTIDATKKNIEEVDAAYTNEGVQQTETNKKLSSFKVSTYIDDEQLAEYSDDLSNNHLDISEKVSENTEQYSTYADEVYETTSGNVDTLKQNISEGQEKSRQKLDEGLEEAKASRETSSQSNHDTLNAFGSRLSYTRLGELENREVYDFIAEPIILDNQSQLDGIEGNQARDLSTKPQEESSKGATITNSTKTPISVIANALPRQAWFIVGTGVLLIVALFVVAKVLAYRRKEEF